VDLSSNDIQDKGAEAMAQVLQVNDVLEELNFSRNFIQDAGGMFFAVALQVNLLFLMFGALIPILDQHIP
jgi:hypothetical protein